MVDIEQFFFFYREIFGLEVLKQDLLKFGSYYYEVEILESYSFRMKDDQSFIRKVVSLLGDVRWKYIFDWFYGIGFYELQAF